MTTVSRKERRMKRRLRVRQRVAGTPERPRMCVMVSNRRIYVQFVDDIKGVTLAGVSTLDKEFRMGNKLADAAALGKRAAEVAKARGIAKVVFDRGGFRFHGRIKAVADAAREGGLCF